MSDLDDVAARLYPGMSPAPAEAPAPASPPATPATPPEAAGGQPEGKDNSLEAIAARRYGDNVSWTGMVNLDEPPPPDAAGYRLDTPGDLMDMSEAGRAAEGRVRDAFLAVGAPPSLAREIWSDAVASQRGVFKPQTAESAEAELRGRWGSAYDAKMAQVRGVVRQVNQVSPETMPFLVNSGLCNNAKFITKLAAFAGRRPKGA